MIEKANEYISKEDPKLVQLQISLIKFILQNEAGSLKYTLIELEFKFC